MCGRGSVLRRGLQGVGPWLGLPALLWMILRNTAYICAHGLRNAPRGSLSSSNAMLIIKP